MRSQESEVMRIHDVSISLLEVPGEVSLNINVAGCPLRCDGCHSPHLRNDKGVKDINCSELLTTFGSYLPYVTCINFMGGEWAHDIETFIDFLKPHFKVSMYTGCTLDQIKFAHKLDYIKVGPYKEELGGLASKATNQRMYFFDDKGMTDITYKFQRG